MKKSGLNINLNLLPNLNITFRLKVFVLEDRPLSINFVTGLLHLKPINQIWKDRSIFDP